MATTHFMRVFSMVYYLIGSVVIALTICVVSSYFTEMEGDEILAFACLVGVFWPVAIPFALIVVALASTIVMTRKVKGYFRGDGGGSNG